MSFLIVPLLLIGSWKVQGVNIIGRQYRENLIQLRDYDFVGEDKRLSAILSQHMALLQAPVNVSDLEMNVTEEKRWWAKPRRKEISLKPDIIQVNLTGSKFNVSLDYADMPNVTDISLEENGTFYRRPREDTERAINISRALRQRADQLPGPLRRAPVYWDPSYYEYNLKVLEVMRQNVYSVQSRLFDVEHLIKRYESDPRFRMAYMFSKLDEWKKNLRTAYYAMKKHRHIKLRFKRLIWYYEHCLRRNIDITYTIEYLLYVHQQYMIKMAAILPAEKREEMEKMIAKKKEMEEMQQKQNMLG